MHKDPSGKPFFVVSKKSSTNLVLKAVSKAFKLIICPIQTFYDKSQFYSSFKQFWILENFKFTLEKIDKVKLDLV